MNTLRTIAIIALAAGCGGCWGDNAQYLNRSDTITMTAGNANEWNAAQHVRDPWPPAAANRNIPGDGSRMVGAVDRYEGRQTPGQGQGGAQGGTPPAGAGGAPPPPAGAATPPSTLPY